jgi:hypothetical protein
MVCHHPVFHCLVDVSLEKVLLLPLWDVAKREFAAAGEIHLEYLVQIPSLFTGFPAVLTKDWDFPPSVSL